MAAECWRSRSRLMSEGPERERAVVLYAQDHPTQEWPAELVQPDSISRMREHTDTLLPPRAVIFDLAGTLVEWPEDDPERRWALSYDYLAALRDRSLPTKREYVRAMSNAEAAHWERVNEERWSGSPAGLVRDGFRRLGYPAGEEELLAALDAYSRVVEGWTVVVPDAADTLRLLRARGYRLGLLSNTWWAADWHDAELATHGLADLLDAIVYTSDLAHSKPHPSVFLEVAARLGVEAEGCMMVGDRMLDDVSGGLGTGMRAVWKRNDRPYPRPEGVVPSATITCLAELPELLRSWGGYRSARRASAPVSMNPGTENE